MDMHLCLSNAAAAAAAAEVPEPNGKALDALVKLGLIGQKRCFGPLTSWRQFWISRRSARWLRRRTRCSPKAEHGDVQCRQPSWHRRCDPCGGDAPPTGAQTPWRTRGDGHDGALLDGGGLLEAEGVHAAQQGVPDAHALEAVDHLHSLAGLEGQLLLLRKAGGRPPVRDDHTERERTDR